MLYGCASARSLRKSFVEGQNGGCEVSTADGPFVVLLSQDGANQATDGWPVREDAHHIGAAPERSCGLLDQS